jgi:C4-dicarboxylate-specific signal transduction histidine kinase
MREVEPILRVQADHVGIVLTFEVPRSCWVYADPRRLKQILLNLGSNGNQTHRGRRLGLGAGRAKRRQLHDHRCRHPRCSWAS